MKILFHSIGCRLNQSEIETMAQQLLAAGHELVTDAAVADQIIVNTCAVTARAARDARTLTRRSHRRNQAAGIILTGCYATIAPQELGELPGHIRIVANKDKEQLVRMVDPEARLQLPAYEREPILREFLAGDQSRTRAFVKVQDGCDNKCTFCVTTIARGQGKSRRLGDVVAEIQSMAAAGYQEAVLTGVHLGSYGRDLLLPAGDRSDLQGLVSTILEHTDIPRLRLSSLEPWDIPPGFFGLWRHPRLLPHLHMPLQSGSDGILRRMARRTNRADFKFLVDQAREEIPHLNLSTDMIVGFPGETEADFNESLAYVRQIGFARLHVFSYSSRPGTAAAKMSGHLPDQVKKERVRRMIDLGQALSLAFHQQYDGHRRDVLWETNVGADAAGLRWQGYTDNYIRVEANGPADLFNRVTPAILSNARPEGVSGRVLAVGMDG